MLEIVKMYLVFIYKSHLNIESDNFMNHVNKGCFPLFICLKSISTGAQYVTQYVTLDDKIKCLSLAVAFLGTTNKSVTGTAYTWELLIRNQLDQSL
jgi:ABC-type polysaccharide/polyol phosphate export permease